MGARLLQRSLSLIAVVAGLLVCLGTSLNAQSPLRLMSFNIRYGTANDGAHRWSERRAAVIATIADHAPHLLGVQEALRFQLDELGSAFPRHREFGVGRDDGRTGGEYAAILVDTARFQVLADGTFWLSDTPERPGSMHWGNRITRAVTWVRVVDRAAGDTVRVYNAHWDHESQPSRERSAELMMTRLRSDPQPGDAVIVMGDFNSEEGNAAFQRLLRDVEVPLRDSFRERHPSSTWVGTFNAFRGDSSGGKIDAVLVSKHWRVDQAGIDRRKWGALWASDHFAVWSSVTRR